MENKDENDDIELKNLNRARDANAEEEESEDQQVEEDTSFTERERRLLGDEVLEMDGSKNLFVRTQNDIEGRLKDLRINKNPSTSTWDPNDIPNPKRDAGVIKRQIIHDKKTFIYEVFGIKANKGAGPYSKILYDELRTTLGDKSGKINGATYKGKKILILMKNGRMEYSKGKANAQLILEFKNLLDKVEAEHNVTPASIVEDHITHEISEETLDNITMKAADDLEVLADLLLEQAKNNIHITKKELSELRGTLFKNWSEIIDSGDKDLITVNLKALDVERQNFKEKALEAKEMGNTGKETLYETMAKVVELKADEVRIKINQKPKGNLAIEILKEEADVNEMSKFDKFKKWAKENLLGLSAIAITIAGIIVTIFSATRTVVKGGATALSKFATAVANIAKTFGPIIGAVGSVMASILMAGTKGLLWLAKNLWLLAVALAYFIYNEYKSRKTTK